MPLPALLKKFLVQCFCWTALCFATEVFCRFCLHWHSPYDRPVLPPASLFGDFRDYLFKFAHFHSRAFFAGQPLTYPAPAVLLYGPFVPFGDLHARTSTYTYIAFVFCLFLSATGLFARSLHRRGLRVRSANLFAGAAFLLSFPFWFELHQGNIEAMVWIFTSLGLWCFWTGRTWSAAMLLGAAAAMKLFPVMLLALFLQRSLRRQLASAIAVAGVVTVVSLWLLCPDLAYSWHATGAAIGDLHEYFVSVRSETMGFDHSLMGLIKAGLPASVIVSSGKLLLRLYVVGAALGGLAMYFLRIRSLPLANQMICLSVAMILLPPVSFDYTSIHLCTPVVLCSMAALESDKRREASVPRGLLTMFALLAFLWSFQSELIWHGVRFAGQARALALLALLAVSLRFPLQVSPLRASSEG